MALGAGICYHMATLSEISLIYSRTGRRKLLTQCKAVGQEEGIALFEELPLFAPELVISNGAIQLSNLFTAWWNELVEHCWPGSNHDLWTPAIGDEFVFHTLPIFNLNPLAGAILVKNSLQYTKNLTYQRYSFESSIQTKYHTFARIQIELNVVAFIIYQRVSRTISFSQCSLGEWYALPSPANGLFRIWHGRDQLSKEEEGEGTTDEVTREDQDKINAFSRLHQKEKVLEEELQKKRVRRFRFVLLELFLSTLFFYPSLLVFSWIPCATWSWRFTSPYTLTTPWSSWDLGWSMALTHIRLT